MTLKDFTELGRADDDWSLETEALQIAGFERGAEAYGADHDDGQANGTSADNKTADNTEPS